MLQKDQNTTQTLQSVQSEQYKSYKPTYILADKAYDTEIIKQTITEETTALPQIPVKTRQNKVVHTEANVERYSDLRYIDSETKLKEQIVLKKENLVE